MNLGKNQEKLLKWLNGKTSWRSIKDIKNDTNFRMSEGSIRSALEGLVKKGLVVKEKGYNSIQYIISIFGKDYLNGYKHTLEIMKFLKQKHNRGLTASIHDIIKKLGITNFMAMKNVQHLLDSNRHDIQLKGIGYSLTGNGLNKLISIKN